MTMAAEDVASQKLIGSNLERTMASRALKMDPKIAVTSDPHTEAGRSETVDERAIAARAYELWQERGCPTDRTKRIGFERRRSCGDRGRASTAA
jgi:hypothetical protein